MNAFCNSLCFAYEGVVVKKGNEILLLRRKPMA